VPHAVEDYLRNRLLAGEAFLPGLVINGAGQAFERTLAAFGTGRGIAEGQRRRIRSGGEGLLAVDL